MHGLSRALYRIVRLWGRLLAFILVLPEAHWKSLKLAREETLLLNIRPI